jgi:two-component system sensor histidine kinase UhpB
VVALPFTYQGRPAVQGIARDITERKRAELALRQAAQRTERLLEQVISVQEEERKRIARELHDGVSQSLMSLLVGLLTFEDVGELQTAREQARTLRAAAKQTLDDVRRLSSGLRPSVLDDLGLLPALERYVTDYASTHGVRAEIDAEQFRPPGRLPAPVETAVYRIVQEAMGNTAKHAGAKSVRVCLDCQGPELEVLIEDDGVGFDSAKTLETIDVNQHMGLRSMEERAVLVGGSLEIDSVPNEGTTILVRIPIRLQAGAVPAANVTTAEEAPGTGQA